MQSIYSELFARGTQKFGRVWHADNFEETSQETEKSNFRDKTRRDVSGINKQLRGRRGLARSLSFNVFMRNFGTVFSSGRFTARARLGKFESAQRDLDLSDRINRRELKYYIYRTYLEEFPRIITGGRGRGGRKARYYLSP